MTGVSGKISLRDLSEVCRKRPWTGLFRPVIEKSTPIKSAFLKSLSRTKPSFFKTSQGVVFMRRCHLFES
ncbi:MAG: hypothetical protein NTX45_11965, partial [Proteobacteria bacterium]|nr:hypothetical protein [Pseudomonadota bacterium]